MGFKAKLDSFLIFSINPSKTCLPKGTSTLLPILISFSYSFGTIYEKVLLFVTNDNYYIIS